MAYLEELPGGSAISLKELGKVIQIYKCFEKPQDIQNNVMSGHNQNEVNQKNKDQSDLSSMVVEY